MLSGVKAVTHQGCDGKNDTKMGKNKKRVGETRKQSTGPLLLCRAVRCVADWLLCRAVTCSA